MKKEIFFLIIVFCFASCKKEKLPVHPLVGTWEAKSFITSFPVDENNDGIKNTDLKKEIDCISMVCDFDEKQHVSIQSSHMTYDVKVENGEVIMIPKGCQPSTQTGSWEYDESIKLLSFKFEIPGTSEVNFVPVEIELSTNTLILKDMIYKENPELVLYTVEFDRK